MAIGDVSPAEAVSKSVIKESITATPTAGTPDAIAAQIVQMTEQGNWRDGLKISSETPVNRGAILGKVEQIGAERDPATGARNRNATEQLRYDAAKSAAELALKFTDKGYDGLSGPEQTRLRDAAENMIAQSPHLFKEFDALSPAQKTEFVLRHLKDQKYASELRGLLVGIEKAPTISETALAERNDNLEAKKIDRSVRDSELQDVQRRLDAVKTRLDEFARPAGGTAGTQAQEIDKIKASLPTLQVEVQDFTQKAQASEHKITLLQQEYTASLVKGSTGRAAVDVGNDLTAEQGNLQNFTNEANKRIAEMNRLPQLLQEEKQLEVDRATLAREQSDKQVAKGQADVAFAKAQREYQDALSLRQAQEDALVSNLEGVFGEASKGLLNDQMQQAADKFTDALAEAKKLAASEDQKALYTTMERRWVRVDNGRRFGRSRPRRVINESQTNEDYNTLLTQGPEKYMRTVLAKTEKPGTAPPRVYDASEIDALIADKDFMATMQPEAIKQVFARKEIIGGFEPADIYTITQSAWGGDLIDQARASNAEFRNKANQLLGAGAVDQPDFEERLKREAERHPNLVALLLGSLVGVGGAVIGAGTLGVGAAGIAAAGAIAKGSYSKGNKMFG